MHERIPFTLVPLPVRTSSSLPEMVENRAMEDYLIGVGKHIRQLREERGLYGKELAQRADVSSGLISRIENGRTVPSLPVLLSIIQALNAKPAEFFQGIADEQEKPYIVVSPDQHEPLEKEDARGFDYQQLFSKRLDLIGFEAMILTLQPDSEREKLTTDAFELKYFLEGTCRFLIGDETVILEEGDLLFFDGRIPHVPKNRTDDLVRILVLYMYDTIPRQDGIKENT